MPLYEYQCDQCGDRFERIQKFSDPIVTVCPKCGGPVRRLVSSPAFQFKGSGWYVTDYARSKSPEASSKGEKSAEKGSESPAPARESASGSGASGTDAKPASSSPAPPKKD